MFTIENKELRVSIVARGAELQSIFHKKFELEYLWDGKPVYWAKRSPILFPIVGTLKNDTYIYEGKSYTQSRHGFAREMIFAADTQKADAISFLLKSNAETEKNFPFQFEFKISYQLEQNKLLTSYTIVNKTKGDLYFSVGGHPAFNVPLIDGTTYTDYYLEFDATENLSRWPISKDGLIEKKPAPFLLDTKLLPLTKDLFLQDALVFKHPASSVVSLKSSKTAHGLHFSFPGFPYLGIWAAKNADFVCIEPWCGIADSVDTDQQFIHKEGINKLSKDEIFERGWEVEFF